MNPTTSFSIFWGSQPEEEDVPLSYTFTESEMNAFFKGVSEIMGHMDVEFLDGPDYVVDENGETVATKTPQTVNEKPSVYLLPGNKPDRGSSPLVYSFDTPEQAEAFRQGVEDMEGWLDYFVVPDATFQPLRTRQASWLTEEGQKAIQQAIEAGDMSPEHELVFATPDGKWVSKEWSPGDFINGAEASPSAHSSKKALLF